MTAFTRSLAGNQPSLVGIDYETNRNYDDPDTFYDGISPGVLGSAQHLQRSLAGNQPTATGALAIKRVLTVRGLLGNQPAATGLLTVLILAPDPQDVVYIDGPYVMQAQYTSSVRP
jgi:hypothetical protein